MPPVRCQPADGRGQHVPLLHLLLLFLSVGRIDGYIQIPDDYKYNDIKQPPKITNQAVSQTVFSLDDVNLACEASGDPKPSFRWVKDGNQFGEVLLGSGTLTADKTNELGFYQGTYRCYAANELGTAVSDVVHLTTEAVPTLPKEKGQKKHEFEEGVSTVLICNPPKSSVTPKIHWMDSQWSHIPQSERVTTSLDGNLYFANLLQSDSRNDYTCNAHYINASIILPKEPISMSVTPSNSVVKNRRPRIIYPAGTHSSYLILKGQTLTLECIPEGLPTPEVHWERKDSPLSSTSAKIVNYKRWLQFVNVSEKDDGEYECTARNSQGSVTHHYTVTVEAAPHWTKKPEEHLYAPGETVKLDCHADGIPTPNITWSINGVPLSGTDLEPRRSVVSGTLILSNVQYSDTAVYQCEATNKHATILLNTHVHVVELPAQILTADGLVYKNTTGSTIILKCRTFGSPRPKVDWEIFDSSPAVSNAKMSQMANGNLQISNVSQEESGIYTCSVRDSNITISAVLEVLNRTKIVAPPQHLRVIRGNDAVLQCKFSVDHRLKHPTIQWKKDGHKIAASANDDKYTEYPNGSLKVTDVQIQDSGEYGCEISTELDSDDASGSITVQDKPGAPLFVEMSEKRERSVTLTWTAGDENNSPVFEYIIEMKEEQCTDASTWREYERVHQDIKQIEIHLQPFCKYHFRVRAVNEIGNSEPSSESESYITPAAKLPPQILTADGLVYMNTTGSTIILKCRTFGSPRPKVDWEIFDSSPAVSNAKMSQMANGNLQISNVSQEESGIYTCLVRDSNVTISAVLKVLNRTKIVAPPQHLRVIRGNDAVLQCKYSVDHRLKHPTLQWKKDGHKIAATTIEDKYTEYPNGSLKVTDVQIQDSGEYSCEISTELDSDDTSGSITVQDKPGAPLSVEISEKRDRSVTLTWTAGDENNSPVFEYIIEMKEEQCTDASTWREYERVHQDIKHIEIHLQPFCKYHFRVRAVNEIGNSEPSSESESYITPAAKVPPQILTAEGLVYRKTTGSTVILKCRTFGSPRPKVDWKIFDSSPAVSNAKMSQMANGNLQISNVSQEESGIYTCSVRDSNVTISAILEVFNRTKIVAPPQHMRVIRGNDAVLQCKYSVDHKLKHPTLQWKKDGHKIAASANEDKYTEYPNGSLKVTDVQIQDSGEYGCEISTELDSDDASGSITVQDKPGAPLSVEISEKRERSVTLTWTAGDENNSPVFEYIIEMKEEQCTDASTWREYERVHQDIKHIEINLQPFCKYHFRVRAVNEIGNSEPSSESESYITPAAKLPPQILTADGLVYRNTTGSTIVLECRTFGSPRPKVDWKMFDSSPALSNAKMSQMANGNLQISNVSQEDSGNYTCSVRDSNMAISAILEVFKRTKIVTPPQHLRVVRGNDAVLQCKYSVDHQLKHLTIQWKKDGHKIAASVNDEKYTEYPNGSLKVTDVQIQDSGEYGCEISTELDSDDASGSITVQDKPGAPLSVEISEKRERSVTLTWTAGDENNSPVFEYIIEMKEEQCTDASIWREYERVHQDIKQIEIHLQPFCKYHFRVRAVNEIGNSEPSSESESYITPAAKLPPQILTTDGLVYRKTTGSTVVLKCRTFGSPRPKVDWKIFDSSPAVSNAKMSQMANGNLQVSNVSQEESGIYTCSVRDSNVTISAILEVYNRTKIVAPPQHLRVIRGNDAVLQCKFSVDHRFKHPTLQWKKDGHKIAASANEDKYTEYSNGSLKVTDVQIQDSGEYGCEISTELDSDDASGSITVQDKPGAPLSVEISEKRERSVTLTWTAGDENNSPVFEYIIEMKEEQCTDASTWREYERVHQDIKHIEIHLQPFCKYNFRVRAVNEIGNSEPSSESESYITPAAKLPPQILTADGLVYRKTTGSTVILKCRTSGSLRPKVDWEIFDSSPAVFNAKMSQMANGNLQISNVSQKESGIYTCSMRDSNVTISAILEVFNRTKIVTPPQHLRVVCGNYAILQCKYSVDHKLKHLTLQWKKDGHKIAASVNDEKYTEFPNGSLKVTDVQIQDSGEYGCEIITELDSDDASGSITVQDKPGAPLFVEMSEKRERSVTLTWTAGDENNSPVFEYIIEMKEEQCTDASTWREYEKVHQDIKHIEIHLQPFCKYHFRVRAVNEIGNSEPSSESESYITPAAKPDMNPENVTSVSTDPNSMIITWKELERREFNGPGFKYKVHWRHASGRDLHWKKSIISGPPFIVNDTGTFIPFEIKVLAVNDEGPGPEPVAKLGHSGEDIPLEAPFGVTVEELPSNKTIIRVRWSPVSRESVRGHLLGYKIHLRRKGPRTHFHRGLEKSWLAVNNREQERDEERRVLKVYGNKLEEVVSGLQLYSNYTLTVTAFNGKGEGPHSDPHHFSTPEGAPGPLTDLYFESLSGTQITLRWQTPHKPNGVITGYVLKYQEILDGNSSPRQVEYIDLPAVTKFTVDSLNPQSRYLFNLRARNSAGVGEPIIREGATMLDGEPSSVINMTVGETPVNLSWGPEDKHQNFAFSFGYLKKEYIIEMKEEQCTDASTWRKYERVHQDIKHIKIHLQPFCKYHFRVRAVNEMRNSEPSSESESYITPAAKLPPQILTADWLVYRKPTGSTVVLECRTFGSPRPKVDWEIFDSSPAVSNAKMSQMANGNLQISNVSQKESGIYTCLVKDSSMTISAVLKVFNRSKIVAPPQHLRVIRGNDAFLQCKYSVDHQLKHPTIQWKKDGHKIAASANDDKYTEYSNGSLKVTDVQIQDSGEYSCEISTELDSDDASGSITVQDKPGAPLSVEISEKRGRSVTLTWTAGDENNSPVFEYIIEMKEEQCTDASTWREYEKVHQDIKHIEIHLQPFCKYHFRVRAVNEIGNSEPSSESESYITPAAKPDMNPENVTSVSTDPNSMIITWKELERRKFNGPGFKYMVYWRQASGNDPYWKESIVSGPPLIVNDTGTFIPFEIKVLAVNDEGTGPDPVIKLGHSGEDIAFEAPSGVTIEELPSNKTIIRVRWSPVSRESVRGHLLGYKIHLRRKGPRTHFHRGQERDEERRVLEVYGNKDEEVVSGLQFYSNYTLTVTAFNGKGEGPHSDPHHFSTPEGAPGPLTDLYFESLSGSQITLRWQTPHKPNGVITGYLLQYQEIVDENWQVESIDLPVITEFTVDNLDPQSRYLFNLRARNSAGVGEPIIREGATMLDGEPPSVINMTVGETSVNLSWVPGDRHRNFAFSFRYMKKVSGGDWEESEPVNSTQAFYQLQGLEPGTHYHLQIQSGNTSHDWDFQTKGLGTDLTELLKPKGLQAPGPLTDLYFESLSETQITLRWQTPHKPNGVITGYLLQYQEILDGNSSPRQVESIDLPAVTEFTMDNLDPQSRYLFNLRARNSAGVGEPIIREGATMLDGVSGGDWEESESVNSTQAFYQLQGLEPGTRYHIQIQSGNTSHDWDFQTKGPELEEPASGFATQGWFIGLISAVVLILLVLLILCFINRREGGKHSVKDKEEGQAEYGARPMNVFGEYSDNEEKRSISQPSVCESKRSSNDSLADYGDSVDIQFNEDSTFFGQYSGRKDAQGHGDHESSGATFPMNPYMPPPSISFPNSFTGILGPN
ncbi:neural cell adhesion molecule L1.1 [Paramisgurnus dabryanus]|uniref:neural cell adhesion molecule L1.1 n=1 Tax=Paramisgurnus dabryanus TaxID=90735 RepID=UPI003CCF51EF